MLSPDQLACALWAAPFFVIAALWAAGNIWFVVDPRGIER